MVQLYRFKSVSGRTILLEVDPEQNSAAGMSCMNRRNEYRMFLPALIEWLISDPTWKETFKRFIDERTEVFHKKASGISNGLRIVSNWALNALGFSDNEVPGVTEIFDFKTCSFCSHTSTAAT